MLTIDSSGEEKTWSHLSSLCFLCEDFENRESSRTMWGCSFLRAGLQESLKPSPARGSPGRSLGSTTTTHTTSHTTTHNNTTKNGLAKVGHDWRVEGPKFRVFFSLSHHNSLKFLSRFTLPGIWTSLASCLTATWELGSFPLHLGGHGMRQEERKTIVVGDGKQRAKFWVVQRRGVEGGFNPLCQPVMAAFVGVLRVLAKCVCVWSRFGVCSRLCVCCGSSRFLVGVFKIMADFGHTDFGQTRLWPNRVWFVVCGVLCVVCCVVWCGWVLVSRFQASHEGLLKVKRREFRCLGFRCLGFRCLGFLGSVGVQVFGCLGVYGVYGKGFRVQGSGFRV